MFKKISIRLAAPCALAMTFGLMACSDDSSGTSANIDSGDEINITVPTGNSSSSKDVKAISSSSAATQESGFINEGWREDCLAKINEYRATENLKPLTLASEEKQTCADKQSADDLASNAAHGHFGDCGEFAQNSGPNFNGSFQKNASAVAEYYLKMMWEEEKAKAEQGVTEYAQIGHYLNMKSTSYTKVACGIALSADGKTGWFNVDFF